MAQDYIMRHEVILISYEDMLKCPSFFVLKTIRDELIEAYEPFIHVDIIKNMTDDELIYMCRYRSEKNPLKYLAKRVFNYEQAFKDIMDKYPNSYKDSYKLRLCEYVDYLAMQKFTDKILIYTRDFDEKVLVDVSDMFSYNEKIELVCGDIEDVINDFNITGFFINDHNYIDIIKKYDKLQYSEILVPAYGYNMHLNENNIPVIRTDITEYSKHNDFKIGLFNPFDGHKFLLD